MSDTNSIYDNRVATGAAPSRPSAQSNTDYEHAEKVLSHLAGRIQELGARLDLVLMPRPLTGETNGSQPPDPVRSAIGARFEHVRSIAASALTDVEDLLNRLDV